MKRHGIRVRKESEGYMLAEERSRTQSYSGKPGYQAAT